VTGELSGLTDTQLRDLLQAVRRIATLNDAAALAELDALAWSIGEMVARSGDSPGGDDWLDRSAAEGEARFREALAAARTDLEHPARIGLGWVSVRPDLTNDSGGTRTGGRLSLREQPGRREARLRPEFAARYPYLTPGVWVPAAVLSDQVVAALLERPDGRFITRERALDPEHFEFRAGATRRPGGPRRREDA
jgi:hypothetical protein